ncbi:MAG: DUF115 domain-containing protein [Candidatus Lernaella stagnicola]|nr:DUF115 domain-containing protein [Candidatus Lernaella stagnicola]
MSDTSFDQSLFEKNISLLAKRDESLARRIRETPPGPEIVVEAAKDGDLTMVLDGRPLLSRYAPLRDVERLVRDEGENDSTKRVLVVLGFELGYVAEELLRRTHGVVYLAEPRREVWRAAFGARDLTKLLSNDRLFLYDEIDRLFFRINFGVRLEMNVAVFVLPAVSQQYGEHVRLFEKRIEALVRDSQVLSFTALHRQVEWFDNLFDNFPRYAGLPSVVALRNKLKGLPAVIVSAGPSLDKNVHLLERWKGRGVIIAVGTSLQKCQMTGVAPDLCVALEANDISGQFTDTPLLANAYLALMVKCHPKLWDLQSKGTFYFANHASDSIWMLNLLGNRNAVLSFSGSVSTAAFSLAAFMGCNPLVLIGQDLAFAAGGESHAEGIGKGGDFSVKKELLDHAAEMQDDLVLVDGYEGGSVVTRTNLRNYLIWFEQHIPQIAALGVRVINATEGGAKIRGAEQLPFAEVTDRLLGDEVSIQSSIDEAFQPDPLPKPLILQELASTKKGLQEIVRRAEKGRGRAIKAQKLMDRPDVPVDHVNQLIAKIDHDEKTLLKLASELSDLLTAVGGREILVATTAFDYEGLSRQDAVRLNLKQTATMYNGLARAGRHVLNKIKSLEAALADMPDD